MNPSDQNGVTQAYIQWRLPMLRFLRRKVANPAEAEDLLQEAFVRWLAVDGAAPPERPRHFLYRIAINLLNDRSRRNRVRDAVMVDADPDQAAASLQRAVATTDGPEQIAGQRQRLSRLDAALTELPARQREALVLHRIDGLTQEQIAAQMGISRQMVVKHIARALAYCETRAGQADADAPRPGMGA